MSQRARRLAAIVERKLGVSGRMISRSKSGYRRDHPNNVVVFNARIYVEQSPWPAADPTTLVWAGDLDLTEDETVLSELAAQVGATLHVAYEPHGIELEGQPLNDETVVFSVSSRGLYRFQYEWVERARDGALRRRH